MNLLLQDVLKHGHEPGEGQGCSLLQGGVQLGVVQWSKSWEGGLGGGPMSQEEEQETKRMLGTRKCIRTQ